MRRIVAAFALGVGLLAGIGCAGNAEYVQKNKDGGIIALKVGADESEARKLMEKHLGTNYVIVERKDVPATPVAKKPGEQGLFAPKDEPVIHLVYQKLPDSQFGGTPGGLPPSPKDGSFLPTSGTNSMPRSNMPGGPSTGFASDPGTIAPPKLFGQ